MKNADNKLTLAEGDSLSLTVLVEENDEPKDLSGSTLFFTIKKSATDSDRDAMLRLEVPHQESYPDGIFPLIASSASMSKLRSGLYSYDVRLLNSGLVSTLVPASPLEIVSTVRRHVA